ASVSIRRSCCGAWSRTENSARKRAKVSTVGRRSGMTAAESYGAFAYAYDQALGERYFRSVRRLLVEMLERYPAKSKTHLDVACGTGLAMPFFAARGFVSTGVDISPVMLNVARKRARTLVLGDTRALPF